jgi:hypothetical protein
MMIVELTKIRRNARKVGEHTLYAQGQKNMTLRKKRQIADDIASVYKKTHEDRKLDPHTDLYGEQTNLNGTKWAPKHDSNRMTKVIFNPKIIQFMQMGARSNNHKLPGPIKDKIKQTAKDFGVYVEDRPHTSFSEDLLGDVVQAHHRSLHNFDKGDSKTVHQYSNQFKANARGLMNETEEEEYKKTSSERMTQGLGVPIYDIQHAGSTEIDLEFSRSDTLNRHQGLMGSKNTRNLQVHKFNDEDVNDR